MQPSSWRRVKAGRVHLHPDTTALPKGEHALRLRVVRADSNYNEYVNKFTIANGEAKPAAATTAVTTTVAAKPVAATTVVTTTVAAKPVAATTAAPTNGITSPKDGTTVSGKVDVKGYASDPSFMKWQLDVLPAGNANAAIFLATGDKPGVFTYTLDTIALPKGEHALRLRVVRTDSNYNEYVNKFTIASGEAKPAAAKPVAATTVVTTTVAAKPAAATTVVTTTVAAKPAAATTAAPTNGITSPKDGATVSGKVDVKGYASDPSFMKWQLDLLPGGNADAAIFLAMGDKPGEFTYTLDTTALPKGEHALRLRVVLADSNYDEYVTKFTVANP